MIDRADLRRQFVEAFEGADYPVNSPMDLVPALPDGPATKFESGDFSMTAMELNNLISGSDTEFPYDSVGEFVDELMKALEAERLIPAPEDSVGDEQPATTGTRVFSDDTESASPEIAGSKDSSASGEGSGRETPQFCAYCGAELKPDPDAVFCPSCGRKAR